MSDSSELRLFIGGWIGGIVATHIPWWNGLGILALAAVAFAVVKWSWWWSRRATKGGRE